MKKALVAYFSVSGVTACLAKNLASAIGADLYEIQPAQRYTSADLNWMDKNSRSSREAKDASARPAIADMVRDMEQYDTVFVAFPIWWYVAPKIINTFAEQYDFAGKTIVPVATSGGSGIEQAERELQSAFVGATLEKGKRFSGNTREAELKAWAEKFVK